MWYCELPFSHVYTDTAGRYGLCCTAIPFDTTIHDMSIEEYFNSEEMEEIRAEFLTGKLDKVTKYCDKCIQQEACGDKSYRQIWSEEIERIQTPERDMTFKLTVFGNFCNLKCYTCHPVNSTRREKELKKLGWKDEFFPVDPLGQMTTERLIKEIEPFLDRVAGFQIIGGEPLLMKEHYKFLDWLIESGHSKDIILRYTSNLTLDVSKFNEYIPHFKRVVICASIDGLGEQNDYIRHGSNFQRILDNIEIMDIDFEIFYTVSTLSIFQCVEAQEFFNGRVSDYIIVDAPEFLSVRHLPDHIKEAVRPGLHEKVLSELDMERDEEQWQKAIRYIKDIDSDRVKKSWELFPQLAEYLK